MPVARSADMTALKCQITVRLYGVAVTCHQTQVNVPRLNPSQADRCSILPKK